MVQTRDITVEWDCNWKTSVDAFNESYHVQGIHPQLLWHLHDLDIQIDCYERHSRYLIPFGTVSPRVRKPPGIPESIKMIMKTAGIDPVDYDQPVANIRRDVQKQKRAVGPRQGRDYSELNDDQLTTITTTRSFRIFPSTCTRTTSGYSASARMRAIPTRCITTYGPTSSCRRGNPGRNAPSTSISNTATRRSAWCSTRMRPTCRTCRPACIRAGSAVVARRQELRIRHFHKVIDDYLFPPGSDRDAWAGGDGK